MTAFFSFPPAYPSTVRSSWVHPWDPCWPRYSTSEPLQRCGAHHPPLEWCSPHLLSTILFHPSLPLLFGLSSAAKLCLWPVLVPCDPRPNPEWTANDSHFQYHLYHSCIFKFPAFHVQQIAYNFKMDCSGLLIIFQHSVLNALIHKRVILASSSRLFYRL